MLIRLLLFITTIFTLGLCEWQIPVQYSLAGGDDDFKSLGLITIERTFDGNYTGKFNSNADTNVIWNEFIDAANGGRFYRVRAETAKGIIQGYNEPCLMLRSKLAHQFRLSIDSDRETLLSLSVFPEGLYAAGPDYRVCDIKEIEKAERLRGSVSVSTIGELPLPETVSYIQKMEKERQARQHGAQQDNRSFLQKYWMYIAAAVLFMVISNAAAGDQGDQ